MTRKVIEIFRNVIAYIDWSQLNIFPFITIMFLDDEYRSQVYDATGEDTYCMAEIGWLYFSVQIHFNTRED